MKTDFPTASVGSSQAPTAAVEKSQSASNTEIQTLPGLAKPTAPPTHSMVLGPRQSFQMNAFLDYAVSDAEVLPLKQGIARRLYIWGEVRYKDVFDKDHTTEFCQSVYWTPDGKGGEMIYGNYDMSRNRAT